MRRFRLPIITVFAVSFLLFLVLHCGDIATDPFSQEKAKVSLLLISSDFVESDTAITDTVDKKMRLGVCLYLTQHIDSTVITIGKNITSLDTAFSCAYKDQQVDTVYYTLSFPAAGDRTVIATAYVGKSLRPTASATIHIRARPLPNQKPELSVSGNRDILAGQTCALEVTANDPDSGQTVGIEARNSPSAAAFDGHSFSWVTTLADTGACTVLFIATDNGTPPLTDTAAITITVTAQGVNRPPKWNEDTIVRSIQAGTPFSLTLADKCIDPDSNTLLFDLLPGMPAADTVIGKIYSFSPSANDTGVFFARIASFDPQNASDTVTVKLTVAAIDNDTLPPVLTRFDPLKDSTSINANSYAVKVACKDPSGVASVIYTLGTATSPAQKGAGDTIWSANVTDLIANTFNTITAIATDASRRANKDTLVISIKYDPTMTDSIGPIIFQKSGPATNSIIIDSIVTIIDSIYDPSGIDSVYWTHNGAYKARILGSNGRYSLVDTLRKFGLDTITVFAVDNATAKNKISQTIVLNYALPAHITSPLSTSTTVVSGSVTALTITATGTPAPTFLWYKGATAISLATSASYSKTWTVADTGTYKVVVSNIAGKDSSSTHLIVTTIPIITTQPSSLAKCPDDSTTFTVTASGTAPLSYQWKKGSANIGANSPSLTINPIASASAGTYTVIVSNLAGSDTSSDAVLTVNTVSSKPTITPASPTTCPGSPITLHLSGGTLGTGASWKWYTGSCGGTLAGSDSTLTVNPSANTVYFVRAEGGCLTTDCAFAQVTMNTIPQVTTQPLSQTVWVGDSVTFSIAASGTAPLTYQWYRGTMAVGANSASLKIKPIAFADSGNYTCVVTNDCGKDTSEIGKLTVKPVFTVSFNSNEGSTVPSQMVKSDSLAKKPVDPTKLGYTFAKWYSDSALTALFSFSTPITGDKTLYAKWVVMDIDGNIYTTVKIGTQTWMVENLKTTRYNDSSKIPLVTANTDWANPANPGYCWYNNDSATFKNNNYGALYIWAVVNTGKLAPKGWRVPTYDDWDTLIVLMGGLDSAGGKLKETGTLHWLSPNVGATNEVGFTALPCGFRSGNGGFSELGSQGNWWTSTDGDETKAWGCIIYSDATDIHRSSLSGPPLKVCGFSVRCILNE